MDLAVPAYPLNPQQLAKGAVPQCCASDDFCFLCEYSATGTPGDGDVVGEMISIARGMADQGKDVHRIASTLLETYESSARDIVQWHAPNGSVVNRPEWTIASITRHVLFSSEIGVFKNAIGQILHTVIYNINSNLIDAKTGLVIEEQRKALMDTIKTTATWQASQRAGDQQRKRKQRDGS